MLVGIGQHGRRQRRHCHREPHREDQQAGQQIADVVHVGAERRKKARPTAAPGPHAHEEARPVAVGQCPEARGSREHHQGRRDRCRARLERRARHLLQEQDEKKNSSPRPAYIENVSMLPTAKLRRRNRPSGSTGARCGLLDHEAREQDHAAIRGRPPSGSPAVQRLRDQAVGDAAQAECAQRGAHHVDLASAARPSPSGTTRRRGTA